MWTDNRQDSSRQLPIPVYWRYSHRGVGGAHQSTYCPLTGLADTPRELGKRVAILQSSSALGAMWAGYLQAAVFAGLDGAHGLPVSNASPRLVCTIFIW